MARNFSTLPTYHPVMMEITYQESQARLARPAPKHIREVYREEKHREFVKAVRELRRIVHGF